MADRREESLTEELISVMDELNERQASGSRSVARIRTWHFTVRMSYVIKRAMDILLSLTALVVLLPLSDTSPLSFHGSQAVREAGGERTEDARCLSLCSRHIPQTAQVGGRTP